MTRSPGGDYRSERDSLGEIAVRSDALWGAQTQRAVENFPVSGLRFPRPFIRALGLIKGTAATANHDLGLLDEARAAAIRVAADEVAEGRHDEQFPVDIFQSGSGSSTNMNANEVIARRRDGRRHGRSDPRRVPGASCGPAIATTGIEFRPSGDFFESLSSQAAAVSLAGQLKVVAVGLMKISNDLRWMSSGPLAGLGEIALPAPPVICRLIP